MSPPPAAAAAQHLDDVLAHVRLERRDPPLWKYGCSSRRKCVWTGRSTSSGGRALPHCGPPPLTNVSESRVAARMSSYRVTAQKPPARSVQATGSAHAARPARSRGSSSAGGASGSQSASRASSSSGERRHAPARPRRSDDGPASAIQPVRASSSSSVTRSSSCASGIPMHLWMPTPKTRCLFGDRSTRHASGSANTAGRGWRTPRRARPARPRAACGPAARRRGSGSAPSPSPASRAA